MKLSPRALTLFAAGTVLLAATVITQAGPELGRPASKSGIVLVPDQFLRRWDPVTIFYPSDVGPKNGGPEDAPTRWVVMSPSHPGAYTWLDARTLQFRPAEPWPALERFSFRVGKESFRLSTLMSPPISSVPSNGAENLSAVEAITLTFPEPLVLESLAKMIRVELRPRPGLDAKDGRWLTREDLELKAMERKRHTDPATYVIGLREPIPENTRAIVHFHLSLDDDREESFSEISFSTVEAFRVVGAGCGGQRYFVTPDGTKYGAEQAMSCRSGGRSIEVELSSEPRDLGPIEAKNLVRITPAVGNVKVTKSGRVLSVTGDFDWETLYTVALHPTPITDLAGRLLQMRAPSELRVFFPRRESFLKWRASRGVVERLGPKMVPVEGRGFDRVDLRIFPIDPLDLRFWPFPDRAVVIDESKPPPAPGEEPELTAPIKQQLENLGSPPFSRIVDMPLRKAGSSASFGLDLAPHLAFISGERAAGAYLVGIRKVDGSRERGWMRIQATDLALSTFEEAHEVRFLVTRLSTGQPVANATVVVETSQRTPANGLATLFTGQTDSAGLLRWVPPGSSIYGIQRVRVTSGDDQLVLDPSDPPDGYKDNRWSSAKERGWLQWAIQPNISMRGEQPKELCHIFTERPVYRPEEEVHVEGWLRRRSQGELSLVKSGDYKVVIQGPGDLSWRSPATFTALGGFYQKFSEKDLPTGTYSAWLENAERARIGCSVTFRLEAYRVPTFEVRVHGPDDAPLDRPFELELTSTYYAGGPVAGRPVRWRVTQFPFEWQPPAPMPGFFYSTDSRYSHGGGLRATPNTQKDDTTNDQGGAKLALNPALEPTAEARSYIVEATVTGEDDQTVTATKKTNALPAFILGLKVPRFLEKAKVITPEIAVVDPAGAPVEGKEVVVRLIHRNWHSHLEASDFSDGAAKYVTDVVDEKILEKKVTSGKANVTTQLPIAEAGVYLVELEARDRLGRAQTVAIDLYAGGEQPVAWQKPESAVFTVSTDKASYEPGETARFVLQSPFQTARALVVVEEPGVNRYSWLDVAGGKATFEWVVKKNEVPRLPVHFVLMRGRVAGAPARRGATDLGKPATMAATSWITVTPAENRVEVKLVHPERARPGEKVDVEISLATTKGKPLSGEVALWLVDQAVLALGQEQALDPLPHFITPVASYLAVRDTRNSVFGELPYAENPGGDAAAEKSDEESSVLDKTTVRKNFKSVPYYNPAVQVGPNGKVKVTIQLPDNLTVFKVRAKAASGPDRFGYGTGTLAVRLPVIVQPALPRFVRAGDAFTGGGLARIVEGDAGAGQVELRVAGATTNAPKKRAITFDRTKAVRLDYPLSVPQPALDVHGTTKGAKVEITLGAERTSDKARDAFQLAIPVLADRRATRTRLLADLEPGKTLTIPALSESARPGTLTRTLLFADEPALVRMAAGLDFLMSYPYGSAEARISRARAFLALKAFRETLHMQESEAEIRRAVEETLEFVSSTVDARGLIAYWPGADGYVSLTAWTLEFLVEAKAAGFTVDDRTYRSCIAVLESALRSDYSRFIDGESWSERVFALEALAHAARFDAAYGAELARKSDYLNLESLAGVVQAFVASGDRSSTVVKNLNAELVKGVVFRLYQGHEIYGGLQAGRNGARSSLILPSETRTVAEVTRALAQVTPDHPRLPLLVDALVTLGTGDGWGSTNANAAALLALSERLKPKVNKQGETTTVEVKIAGKTKTVSVGPTGSLAVLTLDGPEVIEVVAPARGKKLVVRAEATYVPASEGSKVAAESKGFVVTREAFAISSGKQAPEKTELSQPGVVLARNVGDIAEEHVQLVNPVDRTHVAVVIPLAAGMEPLNPSLATAPPEAKPTGPTTKKATYVPFLDDRVAYYYDSLPKGTYDFHFRSRATTAGEFTQPPAFAEMMYDGTVTGGSPGAKVIVKRAE